MENIGTNLKELRKRKKLTQRELSAMMNLSPVYISKIETGNRWPSIQILQKYSDIFAMPLSAILMHNLVKNLDLLSQEYEVDEILKSPLRQFFLNFPDYVKYFKGQQIDFDVLRTDKGLKFEAKENKYLSKETISKYLKEYISIGSNKNNITNVEIIPDNYTESQEKAIRTDLEEQVDKLERKIHFLKEQNNLLINTNKSLSNLALQVGKENQILLKDVKEEVVKVRNINEELIELLAVKIESITDEEEIRSIIELSFKENLDKLIEWLELAFTMRKIQELENFIELEKQIIELRKTSDWENKIKIALPLAEVVGVKIESEHKFNLKRHLKNIKIKTEELMIKLTT